MPDLGWRFLCATSAPSRSRWIFRIGSGCGRPCEIARADRSGMRQLTVLVFAQLPSRDPVLVAGVRAWNPVSERGERRYYERGKREVSNLKPTFGFEPAVRTRI